MNKFLKKHRDWVSAVVAIIVLYVILALLGIGCPIKFLTGISCAGCGMTRAWLALFRLDFRAAFDYHPLYWTPPIILVLMLCKNKVSGKVLKSLLFTIFSAFVIIYLYRMISDDTIVVFEPENNIVFRIAKYFYMWRR